MLRDLTKKLEEWRNDQLRMPLILRGARQVGKSWLVQHFGEQFSSYVEINFDQEPEARTLFINQSNLDLLLEKLQLYKGKKNYSR